MTENNAIFNLHYCLCERYKELLSITTKTTSTFLHDSLVNQNFVLLSVTFRIKERKMLESP